MYLMWVCQIVGSETKTFANWEAFLNWKEAEEEASHSYFVQVKGKVDSATIPGIVK